MSICYNPSDSAGGFACHFLCGGRGSLDNLTHSLTGLALSRAGLNRLSPHTTLILLVAANIPDIDAISAVGGSLTYLEYHRGITHALAAMPVLAVLPVLLARLMFRRQVKLIGAYLASLAGVASHLALDYTNVYGVRLLLPFRDTWLRLDAVNVVDVWIWAVLLLSVLAPALGRLVSSEIGVRTKGRHPGRAFPVFALAFLCLYIFGRTVLHSRAQAVLDSRLYADTLPRRTASFPGPLNPWHWKGLVEGESFYILYELNLREDFDPAAGEVLYKMSVNPAARAAANTHPFRVFQGFAQYPFWRILPESGRSDAVRVEAMDLRFGNPSDPRFVASAIVDTNLRVEKAWFSFGVRPNGPR